ncbi:hypothetical protein CYLTODRAFT_416207 [Cylindrobasidium torrendii FP15055 ss-10]|uniref:Rad21/Rec8-like protein N-terminal domain-containing protein n=1 Tax=Cylindrobasidium torrendii FP15055 ss-10 TaxID=1314674 RepID=A0A0D7BVU4_9AGAR|nr:hypothetical protein CYLTODRAFT_416207 [Cylindrobasidium torrendii FP15055 ss-10]
MFYSEAILSRRGPLGRVWIAAHMERKLSKTQTLQTDIEESVEAIMGKDMEVLALRLSGQLLLGVVRIYSRKAKYLLEDCNEALLKIKLAFRPGVVDMGEELVANKNAITIQPNELNMDLDFPDINWEADYEDRHAPKNNQGQQHLARADDITLRPNDAYGGGFDMDVFGMDGDGIGSQDFDLGINFGPDEMDVDNDSSSVDGGSVGVGRDAFVGDQSIASHLMGGRDMSESLSVRSKSRDFSAPPYEPDTNMDVDMPAFGGVDLGDMGIGFEMPDLPLEGERTPAAIRSPSRASSPLTPTPQTPPPEVAIDSELQPFPKKGPKKYKEKKQIIDEDIELAGDVSKNRKAPKHILTDPEFLPRSSIVARLLDIRKDPVSYFLPTTNTPNGSFLFAGPTGLAPELANMFMIPASGRAPSRKKRAASPNASPTKKRKLDLQDDDEVEQARRDPSVAPSAGLASDIGRRPSLGPEGGFDFGDQSGNFDDFQLDVPAADVDLGDDVNPRASAAPSALSRYSTPALDEQENYADASCPIAMFDSGPSTQSQSISSHDLEAAEAGNKGSSKNTIKAMSVIKNELRVDDGDEEKTLSFNQMAYKASRRAAASFFFELLVLGTRDCVKIKQDEPFGDIEVTAKDKLWETQGHGNASPLHTPRASRAPSLAPSIGSAMGV